MQIDFVKPLDNPSGHSGWLEKKESLRKNWKTRYFYLRNGVLKVRGLQLSFLLLPIAASKLFNVFLLCSTLVKDLMALQKILQLIKPAKVSTSKARYL